MKINGRQTIAALSLSATALIGIANHEKFMPNAYKDAVNVTTIGYGTTNGVKMGDKITPERALIRLGKDVDIFEKEMKKCLGDVELYQHEWDAYVSLTYNIGYGGFCKSSIVRKLKQNPPDYNGACKSILLWNKAGGKVLKGLVIRRQHEYELCIGNKK